MKIEYYLNKKKYDIKFCPDHQGLGIRKKTNSYMTIAKDLKKIILIKKFCLFSIRK